MRTLTLAATLAATLLVALAACSVSTGASRPHRRDRRSIDLLVTHGVVIDPASGLARRADVAVDGGLVLAVGADLEQSFEAKRVLEAEGTWVIPGLADMHTHFGIGLLPRGVDDTTQVLARLLYYGVTTTLNLGSFQAWPARIDELRTEMADGRLEGPRLLAVGALITVPGSHPTTTIYSRALQERIEEIVRSAPPAGPIDLAPRTQRATTLVRTAEDMSTEVQRLGDWGADAIKIVVESGPDHWEGRPQMPAPLIAAAVAAARPYGISVLAHVSSPDELEACLAGGVAGVVHAGGGVGSGLESRMAVAGMALVPTASLFEGWTRYPADPTLLDDPFLCETLTPAERDALRSEEALASFPPDPRAERYLAALRAHLKAAQEAGVLIVAGTDVGNPFRFAGYGLHEELEFYVAAGLSPREALATATTNAAQLIGDQDEWGSLRPGLAADLVILEADPLEDIRNTRAIRHVIRAGRVVDRSSLPVRQERKSHSSQRRDGETPIKSQRTSCAL